MNPLDNSQYNPEEDENQGVIIRLVQGERAGGGVPQDGGIDPISAQGPEPVKEEVNDSDTDANGVNDDMLVEEDVEAGNVDVEYEEGDN